MNWLAPDVSLIAGLSGQIRTIGKRVRASRVARAAYHRAYYWAHRTTRRPYLTARMREYRARA